MLQLITTRLIWQAFLYNTLVMSFKKFYIHLMDKYNVNLKRHISDGTTYVG